MSSPIVDSSGDLDLTQLLTGLGFSKEECAKDPAAFAAKFQDILFPNGEKLVRNGQDISDLSNPENVAAISRMLGVYTNQYNGYYSEKNGLSDSVIDDYFNDQNSPYGGSMAAFLEPYGITSADVYYKSTLFPTLTSTVDQFTGELNLTEAQKQQILSSTFYAAANEPIHIGDTPTYPEVGYGVHFNNLQNGEFVVGKSFIRTWWPAPDEIAPGVDYNVDYDSPKKVGTFVPEFRLYTDIDNKQLAVAPVLSSVAATPEPVVEANILNLYGGFNTEAFVSAIKQAQAEPEVDGSRGLDDYLFGEKTLKVFDPNRSKDSSNVTVDEAGETPNKLFRPNYLDLDDNNDLALFLHGPDGKGGFTKYLEEYNKLTYSEKAENYPAMYALELALQGEQYNDEELRKKHPELADLLEKIIESKQTDFSGDILANKDVLAYMAQAFILEEYYDPENIYRDTTKAQLNPDLMEHHRLYHPEVYQEIMQNKDAILDGASQGTSAESQNYFALETQEQVDAYINSVLEAAQITGSAFLDQDAVENASPNVQSTVKSSSASLTVKK